MGVLDGGRPKPGSPAPSRGAPGVTFEMSIRHRISALAVMLALACTSSAQAQTIAGFAVTEDGDTVIIRWPGVSRFA